MAESLTASMVDSIRSAAKKLAGFPRRQFQAEMTVKYCHGSARHAETVFGWGRDAVKKGLRELHTGERYPDHFSARGRRKTEDRFPEIAQHIHALVEPESQADPKFQTPFAFTRMTAEAVQQQLTNQLGTLDGGPPVPAVRTLRDILNRLGYRLRRVQKAKPQKNSPRLTRFSRTCVSCTDKRPATGKRFASPWTARPR
jgi:hypothetical protein